MCKNKSDCDHLEISKGKPEDCTLNQIIKCHGDQPLREIMEFYKDKK